MGGVLVVDGNEEGSFKQRWSNPETQLTPEDFIGAGIDFKNGWANFCISDDWIRDSSI